MSSLVFTLYAAQIATYIGLDVTRKMEFLSYQIYIYHSYVDYKKV